ncbi:DMT family transporter [Megasphaera sp.]|uniref:EamA family transporter n=1 Tax=Megasphaera sp. TaxID=2023260 RepID=UPI003522DCD7
MKWNNMAPFCVAAAGICWGIIGLFTRQLSLYGLSPLQITFGRALVTALVLSGVLLCRCPEKLRISLRDLWMFLGTGLGSIVFFNICYFTAIELMTLSVAAILLYTAPSIVMVFSIFLFHERFTRRKGFCLVLAFGGCVLVSGLGTGHVAALGILAGLGSGFGYALYSVFSHYALAKYEPLTVTAWTFIIAALGLLPFCRFGMMAGLAAAVPYTALLFALLGIVSTALPFVLYTVGLHHMEAGRASILASVEPLTSTVVGIVIFHEALTVSGALGIICILGAVILLSRTEASG